MKRTYILPLLVLSASLIMFGCKKKQEGADLSGIHTTQTPKETMAATTAPVEVTTAAETTQAPSDSESGFSDASTNVSAAIETFKDDSVSIQYPVVSNMSDSKTQDAVNDLLLANATAIVDYVTAEGPASIDVTCKVISVDRSRLTAVYKGTVQTEGAPYATDIFYTNTVDLKQVKSLGFNDYSDAYTMAGYVMSDDVEFYQASPGQTQALLDHRATMSVEEYTRLFDQADFPLSSAEDAVFPESFSYTHEGVLYFSIPVPHSLGDYAIVTFDIDGK